MICPSPWQDMVVGTGISKTREKSWVEGNQGLSGPWKRCVLNLRSVSSSPLRWACTILGEECRESRIWEAPTPPCKPGLDLSQTPPAGWHEARGGPYCQRHCSLAQSSLL